jgi:hypothetical protein
MIQEIIGKEIKPKQVRNKRIQKSSTSVDQKCRISQPARRVKNGFYNHINVIQVEEYTDQEKKRFYFYT